MITINWIGIICLWVLWSISILITWCLAHDTGYAKARKEWSK